MSRKTAALFSLALIACVAALTPRGEAIVIRNDRPIEIYQRLGQRFSSVGRVVERQGEKGYAGSATLISPHWALTAAHVVDHADAVTFDLGGKRFHAKSWKPYPYWGGDLLNGRDVGLIHFSRNVSQATGIDPAARYHGKNAIGRKAVFVGYGRTGNGLTGATDYTGQRLAGKNRLDASGSAISHEPGGRRFALADFDSPPSHGNHSTLGTARPVGMEGLIGPGDSGGGVFVRVHGKQQLAAVNSFAYAPAGSARPVDSSYGNGSGHPLVAFFNHWIDHTIARADASSSRLAANLTGNPLNLRATVQPVPIPEPSAATLLLIGGAGLLLRRTNATERA